MKASFSRAAIVALGLTATAAVAAPPPGHPSPDAAMQMMMKKEAPPELSRAGKVLSHIDANEYTYAEVSEKGEKIWLAAPLTPLKDGAMVRFPDGVVMKDFYSKLLKRTFPAVMFVESIEAGPAKR